MMNRQAVSRLAILLAITPAMLTGCAALRAPSTERSVASTDDNRLAAADPSGMANPAGHALPLRIPRV